MLSIDMRRWIILVAIVIALDQATKFATQTYLVGHGVVGVTPFFNLRLVYNPGAAFSFLSEAGGWQRWFFIGLSCAVSVYLVGWLRTVSSQRLQPFALALILSGAIGNLIDRVRIGAVIDFLDIYYQDWHFPTFNVADSAVTLGAMALILSLFRRADGRAPLKK